MDLASRRRSDGRHVDIERPRSHPFDDTLWPEFNKISPELEAYLQEVTDRVVKAVLHEDSSDAVVVDQPLRIGLEQSPIPKDSIAAEDEKPDMSEGKKNKGHTKGKRKKKRKKKKRNR